MVVLNSKGATLYIYRLADLLSLVAISGDKRSLYRNRKINTVNMGELEQTYYIGHLS